MQKLEVTWGMTIKIWWSFFWRATLFAALAGGLIGGIVGGVMGAAGNLEHVQTVGTVIGYTVAIPVSIWCMKKVLQKEFKGFSISLLKNDENGI